MGGKRPRSSTECARPKKRFRDAAVSDPLPLKRSDSELLPRTITHPKRDPEDPTRRLESDGDAKSSESDSKRCLPFCGSWWCCGITTLILLGTMFAGGYMLREIMLWFEPEKVSEQDQNIMANFKAPEEARPWEFHYKMHYIAKLNRLPANSKTWTGVEEEWFMNAKADESLWPQYMNGYKSDTPESKTGQLLRDNRLNRKDVLFWYEFPAATDANPMVFGANLDGNKFGGSHRHYYYKDDLPGPVWQYWWHIDKNWIHTPANLKGKNGSKLGNSKPHPSKCTPEFRKQSPTCDRFCLPWDSVMDRYYQWNKAYGFKHQTERDGGIDIEFLNGDSRMRVEIDENGRAKAYTELHGRKVWLTYIYCHNGGRMNFPQWFLFIGEDCQTGKRIIEHRDRDGKRQKPDSTSENPKYYSASEIAEFKNRWNTNEWPKDEPPQVKQKPQSEELQAQPESTEERRKSFCVCFGKDLERLSCC